MPGFLPLPLPLCEAGGKLSAAGFLAVKSPQTVAIHKASRGLREDEDADPALRGQTSEGEKLQTHTNNRELWQNVARAQGRSRCPVGFRGGSLSDRR